jgi:excisionase family DNA binding protein
MTVQEAAEYLRLKVSTIYHYVHHNKIAHYKLGSRVLFKQEDLDNYLDLKYVPVAA